MVCQTKIEINSLNEIYSFEESKNPDRLSLAPLFTKSSIKRASDLFSLRG
jgi:hypothetical protein|tara:strand:+ start:867 stop:1016 length:150 start_codon:yes stop_codon:yes gene_type:complete